MGQHWSDEGLPSRSKVALWLAQEVGEGGVFTMMDVRNDLMFDEVDRRMRELREVGWVIRTYRDLTTLKAAELKLETIGDHVWEPGYKRAKGENISARVRREVFERDNHRCVICGIGAGEEYPSMPGRVARMTIGHLVPKGRQGWNDPSNLRTECAICNEAVRHLTAPPVDRPWLEDQIQALPAKDRKTLAGWVLTDQRTFTRPETLFMKYRQLSAPDRDIIKRVLLAEMLGE